MTAKQLAQLEDAIKKTAALIQRFQGRALGEQNTKASLIEPILEALGWATRDPDEVHREFKPTTKDSPVDYALSLLRKPRLFVEAKGLGETLSDRKWIAQVLSYATVAGVEWCVLTDGDEYRIYNATVPVDAEEKLFWKIRLSEDSTEVSTKTLDLISRHNMEENLIDVLWSAFYVDRRVKTALRELIGAADGGVPDRGLLRLLRRKVPKLTPKEIADSLRRLDIRIDSPTPLAATPASPPQLSTVSRHKPKKRRAGKARPLKYPVALQDIIAAGLLAPPVALFRKYRGMKLTAQLLPGGQIEFQGQTYDSCSTAAEYARSTITGRRMHTNGWAFWQLVGADGKVTTLLELRQRFMAMKGLKPESPE
jgi:hypothetical protein